MRFGQGDHPAVNWGGAWPVGGDLREVNALRRKKKRIVASIEKWGVAPISFLGDTDYAITGGGGIIGVSPSG